MKKIVIFGAGGHGKVVLDILLESGCSVLGFLDEDPKKKGQKVSGFKILGDWSFLKDTKNVDIALGIGNNKIREKIFTKAQKLGYPVVNALHPRAVISRDTKLGIGIVVMAQAVINPGTIIEEGVVVNTGATVDHDCHLHKFCHIWPGAHLAGTVEIGAYSYIGTGCAVIQNIQIGKYAIIGAGAAVIKNIPDNVTAVGIPAEVIKQHNTVI
ncbi:acetyltransferase [Candidatus Peregrinibacteria bacterium]|nr:acetyltransferase [Candidatus Peregrinibacteria bacterium]